MLVGLKRSIVAFESCFDFAQHDALIVPIFQE